MKIIAEFCQNHNGDFEILKRMIHEAAESGATHGKIQTIFAEDLSFRNRFETGVIQNGEVVTIKRPYQPEYDRLKKLELDYKQHQVFIGECKHAGIIPLTTAFTHGSIPELKELGWKAVKVASYDCGSLPLIKNLAAHFDELIISTGASYDQEIEATGNYLNQQNIDFSFLHCVTIYPTPLEEIHLKRMTFLKQFTNQVGLSDHTLVSQDGVKAAIAAIYYGASIIERHFTILPEGATKDGKVSIRKEHIQEIVAFHKLSKVDQDLYIKEKIPEYKIMLGKQHRELSDAELLNRDYYRGRFATKVNGKCIYNWEEYDLAK